MAIRDDIAKIAFQEETLVLHRFDYGVAWRIGAGLREIAIARNHGLVIDIRQFGQQLFYCALPGTTPNNPDWVRRKSNVVARFHRSSYAMGREMDLQKINLAERYGLPFSEYAAHGGSFPLRIACAGVIGSITVSGLPQRQDHEFVVEALCLEIGQNYSSLQLPPED